MRGSIRWLVAMAMTATLVACAEVPPVTLPSTAPPTTAPATSDLPVVRVSDGDTLVIDINGTHERVRLVGINAPELDACWGDEARRHLEELVSAPFSMSIDVSDRDQYERMLRLLWTADGRLVNEVLVSEGSALAVSIPPDVTHLDRLRSAEDEARRAGRGLWAPDACGTPTDAEVGFDAAVFDPPGDDLDPVTGERVTVGNRADTPVDLSGWEIADEGPHRFRFPAGLILGPGESVTVYSTCGDDVAGFIYWCADGAVWSNGGDTAFLRDPAGNLVDSTGPFGNPPRVTR